MIVLHGSAELGEETEEYTILLDDSSPLVEVRPPIISDNPISEEKRKLDPDGSTDETDAEVRIKVTTSGVASMSVSSVEASCEVSTFEGVGDAESLSKEEYIDEVEAFLMSSAIDMSIGSAMYNSPKDGLSTITWTIDDTEVKIAGVSVAPKEEGEYEIIYRTKGILESAGILGLGDWQQITSLKIKIDIITTNGGIVSDEITYSHSDMAIASSVTMEESRVALFGHGIGAMGGWWMSPDEPVKIRRVGKTDNNTRMTLFRYLVYGKKSPMLFSANMQNMAFTAKRIESVYVLDKTLTNNSYSIPKGDITITSSGPDKAGEVTWEWEAEDQTLVISTADLQTSTGDAHIEITVPEATGKYKFYIKAGVLPNSKFIVAAADAREVYNQFSDMGTHAIANSATDSSLISFHHLIDGLENLLAWASFTTFSAVELTLAVMTRGISCNFNSNTLSFVFYLLYERDKLVLSEAEQSIALHSIFHTQERYVSAMAKGQLGVNPTLRKKIAKQWLWSLNTEYMRAVSKEHGGMFLWKVFCVSIPMFFPRRSPLRLGTPMYGVPLEGDILSSLDNPNMLLTDEVYAMMKKNSNFSSFVSRIDWMLNAFLRGGVNGTTSFWTWDGPLVVIKRDGKHQEVYSADSAGYGINGMQEGAVAIPGQVGEAWNEIRDAVDDNMTRFAYMDKREVAYGDDAGQAIEKIESRTEGDQRLAVRYGQNSRAFVIDLDNNQITLSGEVIDIITSRPNKSILIVFEK